ncbi:ABC transporter permease subunit [Dactylosporangium vinaceum]|uniref:ABC transporter permease n=1 Tax=Dactylosporangium vinaceum TaxID=53362 RepID=A0ABV5MKP1_9ACTN|nr:ABC transporter permease [Dactylosporangium vinaceum]
MRRRLLWLWLLPGLVAVLVAVAGPWLDTGEPGRIIAMPYATRGAGLPLGADYAGRDVWSRLLHGGRMLVVLPVLGTVLTMLLGTALGVLAGYLRGPVDFVVSRLDNLLLAIPPVLILLMLLHGWGYSAATLVAVIVATGVPFVSRIARAATRQAVRTGYVDQAVGLGDGPVAVMTLEILPNIARPILADAGSRLAIAIFITASAGFLGFGPDEPNWGAMISQNIEGVTLSPWGMIVPAVALAALTVTANLTLDRLTARIPA